VHELLAPRPEPPGSPEEAVARAELRRRAVEAVLALAEPYRATLIMRFFDEMSTEEIARTMDAPVVTVRTRIRRGLEQLRSCFERDEGDRERDWRRAFAPFLGRLHPAVRFGAAAVAVVGALQWMTRVHDSTSAPSGAIVRAQAPQSVPKLDSAPVERATPQRMADAADARPTGELDESVAKTGAHSLCTLIGTVRDDQGRPVAGSWVGIGRANEWFQTVKDLAKAHARSPDDRIVRMEHRSRSTTTAADGTFRIDDVDPYASWYLGAFDRHAGVALLRDVPLSHPGASSVVDLDLDRCTRISGRVIDPDGHSLPAAWINVVASLPAMRGTIYMSTRSREDAGHEGEYLFEIIPGFRFILQASTRDGWRSETIRLENAPGSPGSIEKHIDLRIVDDPSAHPRGHLCSAVRTAAHLAEELLPQLSPEERASQLREPFAIVLLNEKPTRVPCALDYSVIREFGCVLVDRDEYTLDLTRASDPADYSVGFMVRDRLIGAADLVDRSTLPDIVVHLDAIPNPSQTPQTGTVDVVVHASAEADGFDPDQLELSLESYGADVQRVLTQPRRLGDDRFEFTDVPAGECCVRAKSDGFEGVRRRGVVAAGSEPTTFELDLRRAHSRLIGTVSNSAGQPIHAADVRLYEWDRDAAIAVATGAIQTNVEGRFAFEGLADGNYLIVARAPEYAPAWIEINPGGGTRPVELRLASGVKVSVRLAAPDLKMFNNVQWRVLDSAGVPLVDDRFSDHVVMDGPADHCDGVLVPGLYTIEIWASDLEGRGEIFADGTTEALVEMNPELNRSRSR
jgi:sigma-70-like protein/carboxypeptidase family protein